MSNSTLFILVEPVTNLEDLYTQVTQAVDKLLSTGVTEIQSADFNGYSAKGLQIQVTSTNKAAVENLKEEIKDLCGNWSWDERIHFIEIPN